MTDPLKRKTPRAPLRLCLLLFAGLTLAGCDEVTEQSIDDLMRRATALRDAGELRAASIDLKTLLQKAPNRAEARLMLGQIYLDTGNARSAEKELKAARNLGANAFEIKYLIGRAWLLRGAHTELLKEYIVAKDLKSGPRGRILLLRGKAYLARRQFDEAEKAFQGAIAAYKKDINEERPHLKLTEPPNYVAAVVGIANVAIMRGDWDVAKTRVARAIELAPGDAYVLAAKGKLAFNRGRYKESEAAFVAAFKIRTNDLQLQNGIAQSQIMLGNVEDAVANLDAVLKYFPDHIITNYYRGLAALQSRDFETAIIYAAKVLRAAPNFLQAQLVVGVANYGLGNFEQANVNLKKYLSGAPSNLQVRRLLGMAQYRLNKPGLALATLKPLADQLPQDTKLLSLIATTAVSNGDLVIARDFFQRAIDIDPKDPEVGLRLAATKFAAGDRDAAVRDLERAVDRAPEFLRGQYALLNLYLRLEEFDNALSVANKLREADPANPSPLIAKGLAHSGKGEWADALRAFEEALIISPDHIGAAFAAADVHLRQNAFESTRAVYDRILAKQPGHLRTLLRMAALARHNGKNNEAKALIARAMKANPKAVAPRILLAQEQIGKGNPIKALATLLDVQDDNPDHPGLLLVQGRAQIAARKTGEAALTLERLVRVSPSSPGARFLLAQAYTLLGNNSRARAELEYAVSLKPRFLRANIALVRSLVMDGRKKAADRRLRNVKALYPDNDNIRALESWIALRQDRPADAIPILADMHTRLNTQDTAIQLSVALWRINEKNKAVAVLRDWLADNPGHARVRLELANFLMLIGQPSGARAEWEAIVDRSPNNWIALNNLADSMQDENLDMALEYAEQAYRLAGNAPPVTLTLVQILLRKASDPARSVKIMRRLARKHPDNAEIQIMLAKALVQDGDPGKATDVIKAFISRNPASSVPAEAIQLLRKLEN